LACPGRAAGDIPTDVFSDGQMVKRITGAKPEDDMLRELAEFL
jgi:hypothetical protein